MKMTGRAFFGRKPVLALVFLLAGWGWSVSPVRAASTSRAFQNDFVRVTIAEGLSQGTGFTIFQDRQGFIWIGTEDGLNRYDGYNFRIYRPTDDPESIGNTQTNAILEDSSGTLWLGTSSGLNRYNRDRDNFTRFRSDPDDPRTISPGAVYSLCESRSGILWVGTDGGLNGYDLKTGVFTRHVRPAVQTQNPVDRAVRAIVEDKNGLLWLATSSGLHGFNPADGSTKRYVNDPSDPRSLSGSRVTSLFDDPDGPLWIGTEGGGLCALDREKGECTRYLQDFRNPRSLSNPNVYVIYRDRSGNLLIGTYDGLNIFDDETGDFTVIRHNPADPNSLSMDYVISIAEDRTGVLWIGTRGRGLNKYVPDRKKFGVLRDIMGGKRALVSNRIRSIAEDSEGNIWFASEDKGLGRWNRRDDTHTYIEYEPRRPSGLNSNATYSLCFDKSGVLWVGTFGGGLNRYDLKTGTFRHFRHVPGDPSSLSHDSVRSLFRDHLGILWVGTEGGGLNRFDPEKNAFVRYRNDPSRPDSISNDIIRVIQEDRSGNLWVGSRGGISRLDRERGTFVNFRRRPDVPGSISNDYVMTLCPDPRGYLWVGTTDGLNKFDPKTETFTSYGTSNGFPNNMIYGILLDDANLLWISTNAGLVRFNPETLAVKVFDVSDGLQGNEFTGGVCAKTKAGELFFAGTYGVNFFFPGRIIENPYPPSVALTDFQVYNRPVEVGQEINGRVVLPKAIWETPTIELSHRERLISFEFAALHFAAPEKNRFAYMMEGLEKEWNEVQNRRFVSYSNIPPGRYIFRVKAANNDGLWNDDGIAVSVRVFPPFWKTWWFFGLAALAFLSTVGLSIGSRVERARRRTSLLESKVRERTAELQKQVAVREAAEKELEKRRQYLESIFTNAPNAIVTIDGKGRVTEWNPGAERIFGWRREEALGRNVDDLVIKPELKEEAVQLSDVAYSGTMLPPREGVRHHKSGIPIPVIMGGSPIQVGPEVVGAMFVYTDITEIKRAEDAAHEANRVKSEFLANMSHEIRTPMNGIFGMTELALETDLAPEQREYLEAVQYSAGSLMSIINDILDFSKIEARKIELESIPFRLRDTVHAMISGVALLAEKKGLELAYHIPPEIPDRVKGDPGRLRQILTNLLGNSIKFTPRGEVVVTFGLEERLENKVRLHCQVRDTGIGIAPDKLNMIFAPFTQADSSTTRIYGGTGLGLAITAQLVELMHGRIWVESEMEKGSTFHFIVTLDLQTQTEQEMVSARYEDLADLPVLVVDDNATNRHILRDMLTQWGLKPTLSDGAGQALDLLRTQLAGEKRFKLIITDANMPLMDGFELAAEIKKIPEYAGVQIMMLSSAGLRGDSAHCRELGLAAYLTKPVKPALLLDAIMLALGTAPERRGEAALITRHSLSQVATRYSILLAEDNIINQKLAVRILENRGHRVTIAGDGAEALEALNKERFDVILMDVQMPMMDGIQATAEIRRREAQTGAHVPIIAMTAHAMAGDREKCLAAGMDDYVSKPLKPLDMMKTIQHAIDRIGKERRGLVREI
ncbi:MAG: response regulator [Candidatus Aminicenantes bacterium]|nr:response regulator [Candidatus Aminicenantes bacterium]